VVSQEKEEAPLETLSSDGEKTNALHLKHNGLDYDEFLSCYPRSFTHTTQMKSLVEVSRRVSAVSAGLFVKKLEGYAPDLTVGISEKTLQIMAFVTTEPFFKMVLLARKAVAVEKNPAEMKFLNGKITSDDLRYMKRVLFLPSIFRGQDAYLLLSFASEADIKMNTMLSKLVVQ
jgi:hypothetical protein